MLQSLLQKASQWRGGTDLITTLFDFIVISPNGIYQYRHTTRLKGGPAQMFDELRLRRGKADRLTTGGETGVEYRSRVNPWPVLE